MANELVHRLADVNCDEGFIYVYVPPRHKRAEEATCDSLNAALMQTLLGTCMNAQTESVRFVGGKSLWRWTGYDGDRDGCISCDDFAFWRKRLNRQASDGYRFYDASFLSSHGCD